MTKVADMAVSSANNVVSRVSDQFVAKPTVGGLRNNESSPISINLHMDGIMTRSRADMRAVASDMLSAVNEQLRANGKQELPV